jgi:superfamily II DNA or RNA helicase
MSALLASCFDAATLTRARGHVEGGRVELVKTPPWPIVAKVRDGAGHVATVQYFAERQWLQGTCSCEEAEDCEHVAAAAIVGLAWDADHAIDRVEAARQNVVAEWLTELSRAPAGPATSRDRAVAWVLDGRHGGLGLVAVSCPVLASGELGSGAVMTGLSVPAWIDAEDLRRLSLLRAVTRATATLTKLPLDRVDGALLADLVASGRCFWETTRSPPLSLGPPRQEKLVWHPADPKGTFRLGLPPPLRLVPARDCHYLDLLERKLGPVAVGAADALVQRLAIGPPVPDAMRATVERNLAPLGVFAAPPPRDFVPRLHAALPPRGEHRLDLRAEARYEDQRYALAAWDPHRRGERDLLAEGRARDRLQALLDELPHGDRSLGNRDLLDDARHFAEVIVPTLRGEGWIVELEEDFPIEPPRSDVAWIEELRPRGDGYGWFDLSLGVEIDGRTVPLLPILLEAIREGSLDVARKVGVNLRLPEGELVHLPAERIERWLRPLLDLELREPPGDTLPLPAFVAAEEYAHLDLGAVRERLQGLLTLEPRHEGPAFQGELRGYQRKGVAWLHALHEAGYGGLLADEMGMGKTIQILAFLDGLPGRRALIVAPRSVVGNWQREARRFVPHLASHLHVGADRELRPADLVITSYQTLARDRELLAAVDWDTVIFDEAQLLKNPETQLRAAAVAMRGRSRFLVTGTPVENHLGELWSLVELAMPGLLGRRRSFEAMFRRPVEKRGLALALGLLRQRIAPFLLRRTKDGVGLELPPKTEIIERIELEPGQRDLYETLRLELDGQLAEALAKRGVPSATLDVLEALLRLRQCCCDPRLVEKRATDRGSAKLERLIAMLSELVDSGRRALVFSQFASMLALIEEACVMAKLPTLTLTGQTRDRDDVIRRFQEGEAPIFLVSLKAGGVGLNLTRADTVIHYDPWWNPAVEAQATDRAHRIGQDKPVLVYKLVARGTLEEAILELQDDKRGLFHATLDGGGVSSLKAEDLQALLRELG